MTDPRPLSLARAIRQPGADSQSEESSALLVGSVALALAALVALPIFWGRSAPISGPGSLSQFVAISGGVVAILAFIAGQLVARRRDGQGGHAHLRYDSRRGRLRWFDIAAVALAHGLIALIGWVGIGDVIARSFLDAIVYPLAGMVLVAVGVALTAYVSYLSAVRLTPMSLSLVLAIFLVVGVFASMLTASDPHWWQENLSALGMTSDISSLAFNLTLIVAGVIVTTIAHYATAGLPTRSERERRACAVVRTALVIIGVFLACVGLFPVSEFFIIHNSVAIGMAVVYATLIVGLRWLIPGAPRAFLYLGYVYVAVIAVLAVFFATGYYNLTAVELVAAILIFSWMILFLRNTSAPDH